MSLGNWLQSLFPSRKHLTPKAQRKSAVLGRFQSVEPLEERIVLDGEPPPMNGPPLAMPDAYFFEGTRRGNRAGRSGKRHGP